MPRCACCGIVTAHISIMARGCCICRLVPDTTRFCAMMWKCFPKSSIKPLTPRNPCGLFVLDGGPGMRHLCVQLERQVPYFSDGKISKENFNITIQRHTNLVLVSSSVSRPSTWQLVRSMLEWGRHGTFVDGDENVQIRVPMSAKLQRLHRRIGTMTFKAVAFAFYRARIAVRQNTDAGAWKTTIRNQEPMTKDLDFWE